MRQEEIYHYRHTSAWVRRLSLGTEESQARMQRALNELWPYCEQLFHLVDSEEALLVAASFTPGADKLSEGWKRLTLPFLQECELSLPDKPVVRAGRQEHSRHLVELLGDLQEVARSEPQAEW